MYAAQRITNFWSGARFSKVPETFRARNAIFNSSGSENGEVYTPEISFAKRTSVYIKNTSIKQLCNHKLRDFAMAFRVRKLFGTFDWETGPRPDFLSIRGVFVSYSLANQNCHIWREFRESRTSGVEPVQRFRFFKRSADSGDENGAHAPSSGISIEQKEAIMNIVILKKDTDFFFTERRWQVIDFSVIALCFALLAWSNWIVYFGCLAFKCLDARSDREVKRCSGQLSNGPPFLNTAGHSCFIFSRQQSARTFWLSFKISFFSNSQTKIWIYSKILCPQSSSILVPRPPRPREAKRDVGTRMSRPLNKCMGPDLKPTISW